jgi:hypothetical protein
LQQLVRVADATRELDAVEVLEHFDGEVSAQR